MDPNEVEEWDEMMFDGIITCDEWWRRYWDEGMSVEEYERIKRRNTIILFAKVAALLIVSLAPLVWYASL